MIDAPLVGLSACVLIYLTVVFGIASRDRGPRD
jgi:hypothetical protein